MKLSSCLAASLLVAQSSAISILLPLYIYPGNSLVTWEDEGVFSAIAAYPNVQWEVIVNPNSGPGNTSANSYPDANYIAGVSKLNSYANVKTIGYVDTKYTAQTYDEVISQVAAYAYWSTYSSENIALKGIFYDDFTISTAQADYTYAQDIATYAYDSFSDASVVFNPGTQSPTQYFDYCDTILDFEGAYADYGNQTTISGLSSNGSPLSKSAIVIHDTPTSTTSATIDNLVHTMDLDGVEFVYFTQDCCYNTIDSTFLLSLAAAVDAA